MELLLELSQNPPRFSLVLEFLSIFHFFSSFSFHFLSSVVEAIGQLRFNEPFQALVRTSVGMRTGAPFVGRFKHVTVTLWQCVEDNEVEVDLFFAVAIFGR